MDPKYYETDLSGMEYEIQLVHLLGVTALDSKPPSRGQG